MYVSCKEGVVVSPDDRVDTTDVTRYIALAAALPHLAKNPKISNQPSTSDMDASRS